MPSAHQQQARSVDGGGGAARRGEDDDGCGKDDARDKGNLVEGARQRGVRLWGQRVDVDELGEAVGHVHRRNREDVPKL